MMTQAFYSGINGVQNSSIGIDALTDNLANIDTVGYRGYRTEFSNLFENAIHQDAVSSSIDSSIGIGAQVQATSMIQTQGSLILSPRSTDLAIEGDGWFRIQGEDDEAIYTRDGSFSFDVNNDLVSLDGYHVYGTMAGNIDQDNATLTSVIDTVPLNDINGQEKLQFPKFLTYPPEPSTQAQFIGNIGTLDETRTMSAGVVDGNDQKNELKLIFTKAAVQNPPGSTWEVEAVTRTLDGQTVYDTQTGVVEFDDAGALISSTLTSINNNGTQVAIDLGTGFSGVVALSNHDISASSVANGTKGGDLQGYDINIDGHVIATFTNGLQSSVGRVALFHFQNDQGLERLSGSRFREGVNSGEAMIFQDSNGQYTNGATLTNKKLENSNYSMEQGLTELIVLQRAFDANSRSITTADQLLQKALQMDA